MDNFENDRSFLNRAKGIRGILNAAEIVVARQDSEPGHEEFTGILHKQD